jgi:hypothetical protein
MSTVIGCYGLLSTSLVVVPHQGLQTALPNSNTLRRRHGNRRALI